MSAPRRQRGFRRSMPATTWDGTEVGLGRLGFPMDGTWRDWQNRRWNHMTASGFRVVGDDHVHAASEVPSSLFWRVFVVSWLLATYAQPNASGGVKMETRCHANLLTLLLITNNPDIVRN